MHAEHDAVSRVVRGWYSSPIPELGIEGSDEWFGFDAVWGTGQRRVVLRVDDPAQVRPAFADVAAMHPGAEIEILVDDRDRAIRLDVALREQGCFFDESTTFLALDRQIGHVGSTVNGLSIETIDGAELDLWAQVRLQAFADDEATPSPDAIAEEVAARSADLPLAEFQIGYLEGAAAAILAHYPGVDDLVFLLGTRVPYRRRGIATSMLARWAETAQADGGRSQMINARDGGAPAAMYRRLGFADEVYWFSRYTWSALVPAATPAPATAR